MKYKNWTIPYTLPQPPEELVRAGFSPLLSLILQLRGCSDESEARRFLYAGAEALWEPRLLADMDTAVERIQRAVQGDEKVAVYGDYDVDGITSTCLLAGYLRTLGLDCEAYIPDRMEEGYGLNLAAIDSIAQRGVTLIITVDCGVTGINEVNHAREIGVDMIITDHHECMAQLPDAVAVINPKRHGSKYPNADLAGVGVAFKLICALDGDTQRCLENCCDLVAVGTIADVMPLTEENRIITRLGLHKLRDNPSPGLRALIEVSGAGKKKLSAGSVGYTLAPRLNAAGRLGQADRAARLLLSEEGVLAGKLAYELCQLNHDRQMLEMDIWTQALEMIGKDKPDRPIVLASENWHQGVIGIVASRLVEAFGVPAVMICLCGGTGKGSCRSFGDFNLFEALSACSELLINFGGHAAAAGLNISADQIDAFRDTLGEFYIKNPPVGESSLGIDLRISSPELLDMDCVESLELLEPCGNGNPRPVMCMTAARLVEVTPIGNGKHLKLRVEKFGFSYDCVFFSQTPKSLGAWEGELVDIAFFPQINEFRSRKSVQLLMTDLRRHEFMPLCMKILSSEELAPGEAADCLPCRADLVRVWKRLSACGGSFEGTIEDCLELLSPTGLYPPMICVGLMAFSELGLAELEFGDGRINLRINEGAPRVDLSSSLLLRKLDDLTHGES